MFSAAPGFGATTAVADALVDTRLAWVRLDAVDTERELWDEVAAAADLPGSGYPPPELALALATARLEWIVLDGLDADRLSDSLAGLNRFVRLLPPNLRMVITTAQAADALRLSAGSVSVIGQAELAMTSEEAAQAVLAIRPGLDIDEVEAVLELDQLPGAVVGHLVVQGGVAARDGLEPVVEVEDDFRQRKLPVELDARGVDVLHPEIDPAPVGA